MEPNQTELLITVTLATVMFAVSLIVTLVYGVLSPWHTHITGRGLFTLLMSLTIITGLSVLQFVWAYPIWVIWAGYLLITTALAVLGFIIGREQFRGRKARKKAQHGV